MPMHSSASSAARYPTSSASLAFFCRPATCAGGAEIQPQRGQKREEQQKQQRPEPVWWVARRLVVAWRRGWGRGYRKACPARAWGVLSGSGEGDGVGAGRCVRRRRGGRRRRGRRRGDGVGESPPDRRRGACRPRRLCSRGRIKRQPAEAGKIDFHPCVRLLLRDARHAVAVRNGGIAFDVAGGGGRPCAPSPPWPSQRRCSSPAARPAETRETKSRPAGGMFCASVYG